MLLPFLPYASGRDNQDMEERLRQGLEKEERMEEIRNGMESWEKSMNSIVEGRGFLLVSPALPKCLVPFPLCPPHSHPRPPHLRSLLFCTTNLSLAERNSLLQEGAKSYENEL